MNQNIYVYRLFSNESKNRGTRFMNRNLLVFRLFSNESKMGGTPFMNPKKGSFTDMFQMNQNKPQPQ